MSGKSRIVIVDDHPVMRVGLGFIINNTDDLEVVAEAGSCKEAVALVQELEGKIDLMVLDMTLPDGGGLELLKDIKAIYPDMNCLFISSLDESVYAERVLRAGGRGYLMKDKVTDSVVDAVHMVLSGGVFLSPEMTARMMEVMVGGKSGSGISTLSDRELEVYRYIGKGKSSREIAGVMSISIRTVDTHRTHIKDKMGFKDAADLTYQAIRWVESQK